MGNRETTTERSGGIYPIAIAVILCVVTFICLFGLKATELSDNSLSYGYGAKTGEDLFYPPHLMFKPIIFLIYHGFSTIADCDVKCAGQIHGIFWAIVAVCSIFFVLLRLLGSALGASLGALFVLVTNGFWVYSTQLEVYVPALGCLTLLATLLVLHQGYSFGWKTILAISVLWVISVLYHQANIIFVLPLAYYLFSTRGWRGWKDLAIVSTLSGTVVLCTYMVVFWSIHPGQSIGEFIGWSRYLTAVPMQEWGTFGHWNIEGLKSGIGSQAESLIVLPEYFGLTQKPLKAIVAFFIAFIVVWNFIQIVRRETHYKTRTFFLVWYIAYTLFFTWWSPHVYKFYITTIPQIVVLGSMTFHDMLVSSRTSEFGKGVIITSIAVLISTTFAFNLFSSILPLRRSPGPGYYEAAEVNRLTPEECTIYGNGPIVANLEYYFRRKAKGIRPIFEHFYYISSGESVDVYNPFKEERCAGISLVALSPDYFKRRTHSYKFMEASKWYDFVAWFLNVKDDPSAKGISYDSYYVVSREGAPAYIIVDRSIRITEDTNDSLFESLKNEANEQANTYGYAENRFTVLKENPAGVRSRKLFGY